METFEIQLVNDKFIIEPQENGTYRIMDGEQKLGVIYPEASENGITWQTMDELTPDFVQQLGELISEHQR